jgi:subtilisin family serine protease
MKRTCGLLLSFVLILGTANAVADTRIIVRNTLGSFAMNTTCLLLGCKVQRGLGDPNSQLFLVTVPSILNPVTFLLKLVLQPGIAGVEIDQKSTVSAADAGSVPPALTDNAPYNYYGATVKHGYVFQPATSIVGLGNTQNAWGTTGAGTVAVIDTGVDPDHPVLKPVLVPGYDFTRNSNGANEKGDVTQSTVAVLDNAEPAYVNQSTVAVLDQSTVAVLDDQKYAAFGHGTMTAGVVHLVAPSAKIMPLKAFGADGSGYVSDVMRAIYYAQKNGATVINMSFSFPAYSPELKNAVNFVTARGVVCVASAGNDGSSSLVYPAALSNVMGVASTTNFDALSNFSNYGSGDVFVGAPGEGIITTYPYGTYAAVWGTSFSAPFVAGTAALLDGVSSSSNESTSETSISNAQNPGPALNHGRLDMYQAVQAWRTRLGLQ